MLLQKGILASLLFVAMPWFATSSADVLSAPPAPNQGAQVGQVDQGAVSQEAQPIGVQIEELRAQCVAFRNNAQIKEFQIKIECSGFHTWWERMDDKVHLTNHAVMEAQTSTKADRFRTQPGVFEQGLTQEELSCSRWVKKEMRSPEGVGVTAVITNCEDLNNERVKGICEDSIKDYCQENTPVVQSKEGGDKLAEEGRCVISQKQVLDTCAPFKE